MSYRYFLFSAYTGVFAALFFYMWFMVSRQKKLERKLNELKDLFNSKR